MARIIDPGTEVPAIDYADESDDCIGRVEEIGGDRCVCTEWISAFDYQSVADQTQSAYSLPKKVQIYSQMPSCISVWPQKESQNLSREKSS